MHSQSPAIVEPVPAPAAAPATQPLVRRPVLYLALCLCAFSYLVLQWIFWPVKISGESMEPSYVDGQPTFINRLAYVAAQPERGDVVGLKVGKELYIKRVVALPGEKIEFQRDQVIINGKPLQESYPVKPLLWRLAPHVLGEDEYFVMGDNRMMSKLGPVRRNHIIGKAVF